MLALPNHRDGRTNLGERVGVALQGRLVIEGLLGEGGMAEVYRGRDLKHERPVAVKVLRPELGFIIGPARFRREITIAAQLNHPHVLPLLDSGEVDGLLYYVMPLVEGESLRHKLKQQTQLTIDEALAITRQVGSALSYAHQRGIVHRDIKPENILVSGDQVLVADFGVASAANVAGERLTGTGLAVGTPSYMAPEQAAGRAVDGRADLYALACVLYEMLAGEPPFTGATAQAVLARHAIEEPPPIRIVRRTVPDAVDEAIRRALAKVPADRHASVDEFLRCLEAVAVTEPRTRRMARLSLPLARLPRPARVAVLGGGLALALAAAAYAGLRERGVSLGPRDWVMVGSLQGPSDDPSLGAAVRELVVAGLNQSRSVRAVPIEQIAVALRAAELPETTTIDAAVARELALRTSVRVIITGAVSRLGRATYSIVLHAIRSEDGAPLFSEAGAAEDEGDALISAVDDLTDRTRIRLGEDRSAVEATRPLMLVRTGSFEAFRKFVEGIDVMRRGNYARSNALLLEAVRLDTAFAAAWATMAMNYMTSRRPDSAAVAFARALAHRGRLNDVELYRLEGDAAFNLRRDVAEALRWYDLALEQRPHSVPILNNRGLYLSALGRHEEALQTFATAVTIDPLHRGPRQIQLMNLMCELVVTGRLDSAAAVAARLTGAPAQYGRLLLLSARNRFDSAVVEAEAIATAPETEPFVRLPATTLWASSHAALGRVEEAAAVLRQAVTSAAAAGRLPEARWYWQALFFLRTATGTRVEPPPARLRADTSAGAELLDGLAALAVGDAGRVRRIAARLAAAAPERRRQIGYGDRYLAALLDAREGRWDSVSARLGGAARAGEHDPFSLDRPGSLPIRWLVSRAYERLGRPDSAVAMVERLVAPTGIPPGHYSLRGFAIAAARELGLQPGR
ncbi:MAG TPA: protein kinase [Gemmatimonadales bacterium]|nr:protein kinase [Gemmatimonadales bacterium]